MYNIALKYIKKIIKVFFRRTQNHSGPIGYVYNFFNSLNNLDKIQRQLNVGLKVLSAVGMVFSAMTGFYSFQYIIDSVSSVEYLLATGVFLTSVVSFVRLAKYSYLHTFYEKV